MAKAKRKPRPGTIRRKILASEDDGERQDLAIYGEHPPEFFWMIEPYVEEAAVDRASGLDPNDRLRDHEKGFAELFLPYLLAEDDRFFEQIAKAIRFWKRHRAAGGDADPLREFILMLKERCHQSPVRGYSLRQFREIAPCFKEKADNRIRSAATDVGFSFVPAAQETALDDTDRRLYEFFRTASTVGT